ncbi:thioesterase family protein [Saccharopolyspora mangrovi]|uniref:Thioesterase family protein n=1 Tax=Saccharopolyspora mangrovi TaxID=3082379 RepID=A0ABU6ABV4_9PSEU|nr:thioesterase family protein [Saccharopolyspora sp. S2-29]MEB3368968.1 thioesterase family protein [Saccharopolyspora sp. S2-29]
MTDLQRTTFADVSRIDELSPGEYTAEAHPDWTIGGKPNGGYLLAMLGRAAAQSATHQHVLAASAHYPHSPKPGPLHLTTEVLRTGRSASQVRARLSQDGTPCVEATFTLGTLAPDANPQWSDGTPAPVDRARDDCEPVTGGRGLAIMDQVDLRIDPDDFGFSRGVPTGSGVLRGWLGLPGGENFDPISLLYAVDSFPPATMNIAITGWVPTLELTTYVRALPAPGPVRVLHKAQLIDDNRVDETCYIWDSRDRLVAQAIQLAGIRFNAPE